MSIPGTAVDNVLQRLRKHSVRTRPGEYLVRFLVTKLSWRGNYKRILCVTSTSIVTLHPETLGVTNSWSFIGEDADIVSLEAVQDSTEDSVFVIHFRKDRKVSGSARDAKFVCHNRAVLLGFIHDVALVQMGRSGVSVPRALAESSVTYPGMKLKKGKWQKVYLRITATAVERMDPIKKAVSWRWRYISAASPAIRLLAGDDGSRGFQAFAMISKFGRSPRVYALQECDSFIRNIQKIAQSSLGLELTVDASMSMELTGQKFFDAISLAERERASKAEESPINEWEILKVNEVHEMELHSDLASASTGDRYSPSTKAVIPRRLVLTACGIIERRISNYEIVEWRQLASIASFVRYDEDPQLLGIEWIDAGSLRSIYVTPERDTILASVLYTAQSSSGRPIPVLPYPTSDSWLLSTYNLQSTASPSAYACGDAIDNDTIEAERLAMHHLKSASQVFLASGGGNMSLDALALSGMTAEAASQSVTYNENENDLNKAGTQFEGASLAAIALFERRIKEFNACVPYSGVQPNTRIDDSLLNALIRYLPRQTPSGSSKPSLSVDESRLVIQALHCIQRLITSPLIATQLVGPVGGAGKIFASLLCLHDHIVFETSRLLLRLFSPTSGRTGSPPWSSGSSGTLKDALSGHRQIDSLPGFSFHDDATVSRTSKSVCFISDARCSSLLSPLVQIKPFPSPLVSVAIAEVAVSVACRPSSRTTEIATREAMLQEVASLGRPLFSLFRHPCRRASDAASLLMQSVAESSPDSAGLMRRAAVDEGAILHHLLAALGPSNRPETKLSRSLVALWADSFQPTMSLFKRIFPSGLLWYLQEPKHEMVPRILGPFEHRSVTTSSGQLITKVSPTEHRNLIAYDIDDSSRSKNTSAAVGQEAVHLELDQSKRHGIPELKDAYHNLQSVTTNIGNSSCRASNLPGNQTMMDPPSPKILERNGNISEGDTEHNIHRHDTLQSLSNDAVAITESTLSGIPQHFLSGGKDLEQSSQLNCNWSAFWDAVERDHSQAFLIWNERTRLDLRNALQEEERRFLVERQRIVDSGKGLTVWNASDFEVYYPSLASQLSIGGVYIRLLLSGDSDKEKKDNPSTNRSLDSLPDPRNFFTSAHLYFLRISSIGKCFLPDQKKIISSDIDKYTSTLVSVDGHGPRDFALERTAAHAAEEQELCIRAMTLAYSTHAEKIGNIDQETMRYLVSIFDNTSHKALRFYLLMLFESFLAPSCLSDLNQYIPNSSKDGHHGSSLHRERIRQRLGNETNYVDKQISGNEYRNKYYSSSALDDKSMGNIRAIEEIVARNATTFIRCGGIEPLVAMVASSHEASETSVRSFQTDLITSSAESDEIKLWYYLPDTDCSSLGNTEREDKPHSKEELVSLFETKRCGPISKKEIKQMYVRGTIDAFTLFWASEMAAPLPLSYIRELRWLVSSGVSPITHFKAAAIALRALHTIISLRPAVSKISGEAVIPLPAAHQQLASPQCLAHIAQVMLTGEPELFDAASKLLYSTLEYNQEALQRLYKTGVFFFILAYCGSNFEYAANLLQLTHLKQNFKSFGEMGPGRLLSSRSFLGNLVPESLLQLLETSGSNEFSKVFINDTETPEVIWTHRMRIERLVTQMSRHIGDFPRRLKEKWSSIYEFTPCPPVGYPELEGEIWCHRYYLRHLCDTVNFASWPLVEPVSLMQSLLEAWKIELARKPLGLSLKEAANVLGLDSDSDEGFSEDQMKSAYRRLARKFHPDRNPAGRDRFEAIQKAYERLQQRDTDLGGPQPWRILLIIQAQCIAYERCAAELGAYKYAGYPLLLDDLSSSCSDSSPDQSHFLSPEKTPRVRAAAELCWLTCAASELNAEELARSGGVVVLGDLLSRCISVLPSSASSHDPAAILAIQLLRSFACIATFELGRDSIWKETSISMVSNVLRALTLTRVPAAIDASLQCLIHMCQKTDLQTSLLENGALGYLIPFILQYDPTAGADESENKIEKAKNAPTANTEVTRQSTNGKQGPLDRFASALDENSKGISFLGLGITESNVQLARNHHAALAVRALAAIAGYPGTNLKVESNEVAQKALSALLTQTLAPRLAIEDPHLLLQDLNSTVTSPYVIWSAEMREELLERASSLRDETGPSSLDKVADFGYKQLSGELVVNGIYVRIYNQQPKCDIQSPSEFCKALVRQIYSYFNKLKPIINPRRSVDENLENKDPTLDIYHLLQCLQAVYDLLNASPQLMGLLATRPALEPLILCLKFSIELGNSGELWPDYRLPSIPITDVEVFTLDVPSEADMEGIPVLPSTRYEEIFKNNSKFLVLLCYASSLTLKLLAKVTEHAGCIQALASHSNVLCLLLMAHRCTCPEDCRYALQTLHTLSLATASSNNDVSKTSPSTAVAYVVSEQAGWIYLLSLILPRCMYVQEGVHHQQEAAAVRAIALLTQTSKNPLHGPKILLLLRSLLSPGIAGFFQDSSPEDILEILYKSIETPECLWTDAMRSAASEEIMHRAHAAREYHGQINAEDAYEWKDKEEYELEIPGVENKTYIGGVYLHLYLKNPAHPLRNPQHFLQCLLEEYIKVAENMEVPSTSRYVNPNEIENASSYLSLLSTSAIAAMQYNPPLADHSVSLGYVPKLIRILKRKAVEISAAHSSVEELNDKAGELGPPDDVSICTLRLLHASRIAHSFGESLAHSIVPAMPILVGCMLWRGEPAVLTSEIIKQGLDPINRARDSIVGDCLRFGLLGLLFERLDWRSTEERALHVAEDASGNGSDNMHPKTGQNNLDKATNSGIERVLYVEIIRLLELDGIHTDKVRKLLNDSDVWNAYSRQSHDLFLPVGGTAAALTSSGYVGLLQGSGSTKLMLSSSRVEGESEISSANTDSKEKKSENISESESVMSESSMKEAKPDNGSNDVTSGKVVSCSDELLKERGKNELENNSKIAEKDSKFPPTDEGMLNETNNYRNDPSNRQGPTLVKSPFKKANSRQTADVLTSKGKRNLDFTSSRMENITSKAEEGDDDTEISKKSQTAFIDPLHALQMHPDD